MITKNGKANTHIGITAETRKKLNLLKIKYGFSSHDETISAIIEEFLANH